MTFASKITITRIVMVPVFAVLAVSYGLTVKAGQPDETLRWWALGIYSIAAASDGIDGWIARHFNQRSAFGAFIDPIADKALLLTGVVTLALVDWGHGVLPAWFAVMVVLRDAIILGGIRALSWSGRDVHIAPHWSGKLCTVSQMAVIGWVMLKITALPLSWLCWVAAFFTAWSTVAYVRKGLQILTATTSTAGDTSRNDC